MNAAAGWSNDNRWEDIQQPLARQVGAATEIVAGLQLLHRTVATQENSRELRNDFLETKEKGHLIRDALFTWWVV
ncbi:hypothetical protein VA602_13865 [Pseudomonas sp. MH2]|uniref:Uncharacterized protein n=1 Tax=Pseudomonas machongensis TaxID=3110229 RepID=A0ABU5VGC3_9PSED|nr:hypothetical protein [Pseudomonas sp. MH2]MEA5672423.1 hypothetical protein [Pseudomonas sp. MH2]